MCVCFRYFISTTFEPGTNFFAQLFSKAIQISSGDEGIPMLFASMVFVLTSAFFWSREGGRLCINEFVTK